MKRDTLTKKKLVLLLKKIGGISIKEARAFINAFFSVAKEALASKLSVSLRGFGVIYPYFVQARTFKTNLMIFQKKVKGYYKPKFRASTIFIKDVNHVQ